MRRLTSSRNQADSNCASAELLAVDFGDAMSNALHKNIDFLQELTVWFYHKNLMPKNGLKRAVP